MSITLIIVVLCSSIVGFFSKEFQRLFTRIFSIPGMLLLLPLLLFSLVLESNPRASWWVLSTLSSGITWIEAAFGGLISHQATSVFVSRVLTLTLLPLIPLMIIRFSIRHKPTSKAMQTGYRIAAIIWIVTVILLASVIDHFA